MSTKQTFPTVTAALVGITLSRIVMKSIHPVEWEKGDLQRHPAGDSTVGQQKMKIKTFTPWNSNLRGAEKNRGFIPLGNNRHLEGRNNFSFLLSRFLLSPLAFAFCFLLSQFLILPSFAQTNLVTPFQYLQMQPYPNFASGYHLPRLTTYNMFVYTNLNIELASHWGYCLNLYIMGSNEVSQIGKKGHNFDGWTSDQFNSLIALASNNPTQFPAQCEVEVQQYNLPPLSTPAGYWVTNCAGWFVGLNPTNDLTTVSWQNITNRSFTALPSPEAPDSYWSAFGSNQAWCLSVLHSNVPISMIIIDGEYGMQELGPNGQFLVDQQDCRVQQQAVMTNPFAVYTNSNPYVSTIVNTNGMSWPEYASNRKAHQLSFLTAAIRKAVPDRRYYIYYQVGNEVNQLVGSNAPAYWWQLGDQWGFWSGYMMGTNQSIGINSDLPSWQDYYEKGLYNYTNIGSASDSYMYDLLTMHLNQVGYDLFLGYTNSYEWLCAGWSRTDTNALSDIPTYTGFLKCLYTAGMVGGNAGYYTYPTNTVPSIFGETDGTNCWEGRFPTNLPPHWLLQVMALSHVHALFSHLENVVTNGDLLSGPQVHAMAATQPAYEFTNTAGNPFDRVLVRQLRGTNYWIVTAWAADGITNNVTVTIPTIGNLTVNAIPSASVYQVTMSGTNVQQTLLDEYASYRPPPPLPLRIVSP